MRSPATLPTQAASGRSSRVSSGKRRIASRSSSTTFSVMPTRSIWAMPQRHLRSRRSKDRRPVLCRVPSSCRRKNGLPAVLRDRSSARGADARRRRPERVAQERLDGLLGEGREVDARGGHPGPPELALEPRERVPDPDVPRTKGAEQEHVLSIGIGGERAQSLQARGVRPVQVVQEDHEGPPGRREDLNEGLQRDVETGLRLEGLERRQRRLRPDQVLELGQQLGQDAAVARRPPGGSALGRPRGAPRSPPSART